MKHQEIIGRKKECTVLDKVMASGEAEFLAVYGRRRVGKTHLIRTYFSDKGVFLESSGIKNASQKKQIESFMKAVSKTFFNSLPLQTLSSWDEVFELLTREIEKIPKSKKVIIFLDELPWMATKKSGLLQTIDYYWNLHWSKYANLIFVACGSAASWMLDQLIYAKGGLHNRITRKILLEPFSLKETKDFLRSRSIQLNEKQILDIYMAIGGIPHYLKSIDKGMSAAQNIEEICFQKNGVLYNEFTNLFDSLFDQSEENLTIVRSIVKNSNEISRNELIKRSGIKTGGTLNKRLKELEASGFIRSFLPYGRKKRGRFYQVTDEYSLFYLTWIEPMLASSIGIDETGYWQNRVKTPAVLSWAGFAFENVCLKHIGFIRAALGLNNIACITGRWRYLPKRGEKENGAQIDLLFDREDGVVTICEIKYSENAFKIDKKYAKELMNKTDVFEKSLKTNKQIFLAMIATAGVAQNAWSEELVENVVTLEDLFR